MSEKAPPPYDAQQVSKLATFLFLYFNYIMSVSASVSCVVSL